MTNVSRVIARRQPRLRAALASLVLSMVSGGAFALLGDGVTPIGKPFLAATVGEYVAGPYSTSVTPDLGSQLKDESAGGSADAEKFWQDDFAQAHSDETGIFWAHVVRGYKNPMGTERPGIASRAIFQQKFRKDVDTAWMKFTVTAAYLHADRGLALGPFGGVAAGIDAQGYLYTEIGDLMGLPITVFDEKATLYTQPGGTWVAFKPRGPMTWSMTRDEADVKDVTFDRYTGTVDLSAVGVGETFTVLFDAQANGLTGPAERPARAEAFFRDPLTGGGALISTEGLTPLNRPVTSPIPRDRGAAQVVQPDGKIVVVGMAYAGSNYHFALARHNPDGTLDTAFGVAGKVTTEFGVGSDAASAVAIQDDGRLIVAGSAQSATQSDFALARYNTDGSLDTSFGVGGKMMFDFSGFDDRARALTVLSSGAIVVAGFSSNGTDQDFALARLDAAGQLDNAFGSGGKVTTDFGGASDMAQAMAMQSDGKMVVAGHSDNGSTAKADFALARYNDDGSLDTNFGAAGKVTTDFASGPDFARALVIQSTDHKIVVAGTAYNGANNDLALARIDSSGNPDAGFGSNGKATLDFAGDHDYANAIVLQGDGKIVVAGYAFNGSNDDFALARFGSSGVADTDFGVGGRVIIDFDGQDDRANTVVLQADGKILAAGHAATATGDDFALARLTR